MTQESERALVRALDAVEQGAGARALDHFVEAWGGTRDPRLAHRVEQLAERVPPEPFSKYRTQKAAMVAWVERAREGRARDLSVLVPAVDHAIEGKRKKDAAALLDELLARPPDPRLLGPLGRWGELLAYRSWWSASAVWTRWGNLLAAHRCERAQTLLDRLAPALVPDAAKAAVDEQLARARRKLARAEPAAEALSPALVTLVESIGTAIDQVADLSVEAIVEADGSTETDLRRAVYDRPGDDQPRLVLADWLHERGEPWGELITLQLSGARETKKRLHALAASAHDRALGPLAPLVRKARTVFERGFPAELHLAPLRAKLARAERDHPEWATVERLAFAEKRGCASLLSPQMRSLRAVVGVRDASLVEAAAFDVPPALEAVGYVSHERSLGREPWLARHPGFRALLAGAFPAVRALGLSYVFLRPEWLHPLLESLLGEQLTTLVVRGASPEIASEPPGGRLHRLVLGDRDLWWDFSRHGDGWHLQLVSHLTHDQVLGGLLGRIARLPLRVVGLDVRLKKAEPDAEAQLARFSEERGIRSVASGAPRSTRREGFCPSYPPKGDAPNTFKHAGIVYLAINLLVVAYLVWLVP